EHFEAYERVKHARDLRLDDVKDLPDGATPRGADQLLLVAAEGALAEERAPRAVVEARARAAETAERDLGSDHAAHRLDEDLRARRAAEDVRLRLQSAGRLGLEIAGAGIDEDDMPDEPLSVG